MNSDKSDLRVGELLIESQILRPRELSDAIKVAKFTGLPIGRVLVMSSYVHEKEFQAAVKAQSMVRDGLLPLGSAIQALTRMYRNQYSFDDALAELGWVQQSNTPTNKLGELLRECQIITNEQFEKAMQTGTDTSLPLGRVLVSLGYISDETLATALNTQILVRDGKISRDQGLAGLKAAHQRRLPIELTLVEKGFYRGPAKAGMRLGELLVLAGLTSQTDIMNALEIALTTESPLGQTLIRLNALTPPVLDAALTLQEMVANRTLDSNQAAQCLYKVFSGETMDEALCSLTVPDTAMKITVRYHDMLRVAGMLQHSDIELSDIERDVKPSMLDAVLSAKKFLQNGFIDERTYYGSLRCYFLMASGWLNIQQGMIALNYFHHKTHLKFDEILYELDWAVRTRPQLPEDTKQSASEKV